MMIWETIKSNTSALTYCGLLSLSFITWFVGENDLGGILVSSTVLALALIKGMLIGDYFMGLKTIKGAWRWSIHLWLLLPALLILTAFIKGYS